MPAELIARVEAWADQQHLSRSEAIRRLVELGLSASQPRPAGAHKAASTARELAGEKLDRMGDASATDEQRATRKRRLLKGPEEFREDRRDQPAAKKR